MSKGLVKGHCCRVVELGSGPAHSRRTAIELSLEQIVPSTLESSTAEGTFSGISVSQWVMWKFIQESVTDFTMNVRLY